MIDGKSRNGDKIQTPRSSGFSIYLRTDNTRVIKTLSGVHRQGVAPTLIVVRAEPGKSVESLQEHPSDIHFTSRPAPLEQTRT
ncbi:hypothetical protein WG66_008766 [Moniliophthora roreri]|nr:hypothetical protein WG66_008766 [Moniliophthora roreri]